LTPLALPPSPTRRSSDLSGNQRTHGDRSQGAGAEELAETAPPGSRQFVRSGHGLLEDAFLFELGPEGHPHAGGWMALRAQLEQRSEEHTSELQSRFDLVC